MNTDPNDEAERLLRRAEVLFRQLCRLSAADQDELPALEANTLAKVKDLRSQLDGLARFFTVRMIASGSGGRDE